MRKIAIEEHYFTQYFIDYMTSRKKYPRLDSAVDEKDQKIWRWWNSAEEYQIWLQAADVDKLCDIEEGRLRDMDEAGIDMQVVSSNPPIGQLDAIEGTTLERKINDIIAVAVKKHPDRFAGFAGLFLKNPKAAADELERTVRQLGFKGAMIYSHVGGEFLDAKKYWPVFERAARLGVPIYIHPAYPPPERLKQYSGYPRLVSAMWGYAAETGLTAMRLICSGIFDEYPDLKIILGHMGEALPFWMSRLDTKAQKSTGYTLMTKRDIEDKADVTPLTSKLKKLPSQYIRDNFFVTTSGVLWQPALLCAQLALGADRILFAADYPFEPSRKAVEFMEAAAISDSDKEKLFHSNAEKLLHL